MTLTALSVENLANQCAEETEKFNRRQPNAKRVPFIPMQRATPDLAKVEEVGFSDLMEGGWIPATSRVAFFELYGKSVPRKP